MGYTNENGLFPVSVMNKFSKYLITISLGAFMSFLCTHTFAQTIVLNRSVVNDTLGVRFSFADQTDPIRNQRLEAILDSVIDVFNRGDRSVILVKDYLQAPASVHFTIDTIHFVNRKRNFVASGINLAGIGANILILPFAPPLIPFYFMPLVHSNVRIDGSAGLAKKIRKFNVHANGYFAGEPRQQKRYDRHFGKSFHDLFVELDLQIRANKKRQSP